MHTTLTEVLPQYGRFDRIWMIYSECPCQLSRGHFTFNSRPTYKVTAADTKWSLRVALQLMG